MIIKTGPLFDGRATIAAEDARRNIEQTVATLGAATLRSSQQATFKQETPYYRLRTQARPDNGHWKISDGGVIYGPWLEGTGSRNFPKTRFRGYALFRKTTTLLNRKAVQVANAVLARFMGRMN